MPDLISYEDLVKKVNMLESALIDLGVSARKESKLNLEGFKLNIKCLESMSARVSELEAKNG